MEDGTAARGYVIRAMDPEEGFRTLPRFFKVNFPKLYLPDLDGLSVGQYWTSCLRFIETFIEPLARTPAEGGHPKVHRLAQELARTNGAEDFQAVLGLPEGTDLDGLFAMAPERFEPPVCLCLAALRWAMCGPGPQMDWSEDHCAVACFLTIHSLRLLGRSNEAAHLGDQWLRLSESDYRDPEALAEALARSPLWIRSNPFSIQLVLCNLALALQTVRGRGDRQARVLLEAWLGLTPDSYASRAALEEALRRSDVGRINDPAVRFQILRCLVGALISRTRRVHPKPIRYILEIGLGLSRSTYASRAVMKQALDRSPLSSVSDPDHRARTVFVLAAALSRVRDRARHAVLLLEAWLNLDSCCYRDTAKLRNALRGDHSTLAPLSPLGRGRAVGSLLAALGRAHRKQLARRVFLVWLGIDPGTPPKRPVLEAVLRNPDSPLSGLNPELRDQLLEMAVVGLPHEAIGPRLGALLEIRIGLGPADLDDPVRLARILAPRPRVEGEADRVPAFAVLALAERLLERDRENGPSRATRLLEAWLGLSSGTYADRASIARKLREQFPASDGTLGRASRPIDATRRRTANRGSLGPAMIDVLSESLRRTAGRGPADSVALIEAWLDLTPEHYEGRDAVRPVLRRAFRRPERIEMLRMPRILARYASGLARLPDRGQAQAIDCLQGVFKGCGRFPGRPFGDPTVDALMLPVIISELHSSKGRAMDSDRNLLSAWLGVALSAEVCCPFIAIYEIQVRVALKWGPRSAFSVAICRSVVHQLLFARDRPRRRNEHDVRHAGMLRTFFGAIQQIGLSRAIYLRKVGRDGAADRQELEVLWWAEQFENHQLVERLETSMQANAEWAEAPPASRPTVGTWPLPRSVAPPASFRFVSGYLPPFALERDDPHCLGLRNREAREGPVRPSEERGSMRRGKLRDIEGRVHPRAKLARLVPQGAILVRTLFELDGTLRWWALRRDGHSLRIIASGTSRPGAYERLRLTNLEFDLAVERIWANHAGHRLTPEIRAKLLSLASIVHETALADLADFSSLLPLWDRMQALLPGRPLMAELANTLCLQAVTGLRTEALRTLVENWKGSSGFVLAFLAQGLDQQVNCGANSPALDVFSSTLLAAHDPLGTLDQAAYDVHPLIVSRQASVFEFLVSKPRRAEIIKELLAIWDRQLGGDVTPHLHASYPIPGVDTLRAQLDQETSHHILATQREIDLCALCRRDLSGGLDGETDMLFQVQGPLYAAPLAWLSLDGEPLFRRVASTGTVVSLTFRRFAEAASRIGLPSRRILSSHWLEERDWRSMRGLAYLHAGLLRLGAKFQWEVHGLGRNPEASVQALSSYIGRADLPYAIAVVGGHGDLEGAGLALKGGIWRGEGDLSRLDLLLLVTCAVGRMKQKWESDAEGLYAELASHGNRCAIVARWPIADCEAATFITEVVFQYLAALPTDGPVPPFARARALNRARVALLQHPDLSVRVSDHLASAFEILGCG